MWEYQIVSLWKKAHSEQLKILEQLGQEGWELVTVYNDFAYLKRPFKYLNYLKDKK